MAVDNARAKIRAIEKHLQAGGRFHLRSVQSRRGLRLPMPCRFSPRVRWNGNAGEHHGDKCEPQEYSHTIASPYAAFAAVIQRMVEADSRFSPKPSRRLTLPGARRPQLSTRYGMSLRDGPGPRPIETLSLPTLTRSYPCRFTFYVARPTRSIRKKQCSRPPENSNSVPGLPPKHVPVQL
jgi:hypothetical protein